MPDVETILIDVSDRVATIQLNRPDRLNAYTVRMGAELFRTFRALADDDAVRAIVVTGSGRGFCAGMDLSGGDDTFAVDGAWDETRALERDVQPWSYPKPIIAAINGPAVGIGATLPLQWDIRIAGESARIGFVFTRRGIIPEAGSTWLLPRLIGMAKATDLLLTGRIIDAQTALAYGIVSRVVPDAELLAVAQGMARDIADHSAPVSVAVTKQLLWRQWMQPDPRAAKRLEDALFHWIGRQPDAAEGVRSFMDKRLPEWTMSAARDLPELLSTLDDESPDP